MNSVSRINIHIVNWKKFYSILDIIKTDYKMESLDYNHLDHMIYIKCGKETKSKLIDDLGLVKDHTRRCGYILSQY